MIKQPPLSSLCGHCCLAMILHISLDEAISLITHRRGTKTKELIKHFNHVPLKIGIPKDYSLCKVWRMGHKKVGHWHWVLFNDGMIYDPELGYWIDYGNYRYITNLSISSHIVILGHVC